MHNLNETNGKSFSKNLIEGCGEDAFLATDVREGLAPTFGRPDAQGCAGSASRPRRLGAPAAQSQPEAARSHTSPEAQSSQRDALTR